MKPHTDEPTRGRKLTEKGVVVHKRGMTKKKERKRINNKNHDVHNMRS